MSEDPDHPWGTGATRYRYTPQVTALVRTVEARFPGVEANTYVCHPWCGWARLSVDFWWMGGRGDPLPTYLGPQIRTFLMDQEGSPFIRHTIWEHQIWTSWGGYSYWSRDDHTGSLRHLHVTYYPH